MAIVFPPGFVWGAATSSFQIEGSPLADGATASDWWQWTHTPGKIGGGDDADVACDHYRRRDDDVALMRTLGLGAYRFSLSWPRIVPARGEINEQAIDFYRRLFDALDAAGIEPFPTLYHWELPTWAAGGWESRATVDAFDEYADAVFARLGPRARRWATMNEPSAIAHMGYLNAYFPPGRRDARAFVAAVVHLGLAHGRAAQRFRARCPSGELGVADNVTLWEPASDDDADVAQAARMDVLTNGVFLDPRVGRGWDARLFDVAPPPDGFDETRDAGIVAQAPDWMGVNHYFPSFARHDPDAGPLQLGWIVPPGMALSDLDWPIEPAAMRAVLVRIQRRHAPRSIYVTESGLALRASLRSADELIRDDTRIHFLGTTLAQVRAAIDDGAAVSGFFAWSLFDNFEWGAGYDPQFGLVHVDRTTLARTPKRSAIWYGDVMRTGRVDVDALPPPRYRRGGRDGRVLGFAGVASEPG